MHDQSLEQKLRAALQAEGDGQPFTITAAELERRHALRHRGGLGPTASLGLAAAVGIGLLGLAGLAGGWFEQRPQVAPSPSLVAIATAGPSAGSSVDPSADPSGAPVLPSLDEIVASRNAAQIVLAQAVGPASGPDVSPGPGPDPSGEPHVAALYAPVIVSGTYAVTAGCMGSLDLQVLVVKAPSVPERPGRSVPWVCGGGISSRLIDIAAGDALAIKSSGTPSWRIAIEAPVRDVLHAATIGDIVVPDGAATLLDVRSPADLPDYGATQTGGGPGLPADFGWVNHRDEYHVLVSCAGPRSIRYAFTQPLDQTTPEAAFETYANTEVECDGAVHEDVLGLPLDEAHFVVTSSDQTAWHIVVTGAPLPIEIAPDEGGWVMAAALGPTYESSGNASSVSMPATENGGRTRVVISCSGETALTGSIDYGPLEGQKVDPFTIDCGALDANTVERIYPDAAAQLQVAYDPHGAPVWLVVTFQVRAPANPAP